MVEQVELAAILGRVEIHLIERHPPGMHELFATHFRATRPVNRFAYGAIDLDGIRPGFGIIIAHLG